MWDGLQKNSGSLRIWEIASQNPAETITIGPITAKIDTRETNVVDFINKEFEKIWSNFILLLGQKWTIWKFVILLINNNENYA